MRYMALFLGVTFGWSWGFWLIPGLPASVASLGGWGPLVGALVLAWRLGTLRALLGAGLRWRMGWPVFLIALLCFPILIGAAFGADLALGAPFIAPESWVAPATLPIAYLYILLLAGPLQEEFAWRGTLQPWLEQRISPAWASLGVGLVWGVWHLPLFLTPGHGVYYERPFFGLLITTVLISFIFTYLYRRSAGNILAMMILHAGFNFGHFIFPTLQSDRAALILFALQALIVIIIMVKWRSEVTKPSRSITQ